MAETQPRVLYGVADYRSIVEKNGYYVDKTHFIPMLERFQSPVFLRPRRFGKSLLCTMLQYYYDASYAGAFETLFGKTWIGRNPTAERGSYSVLHFDFSVVDATGTVAEIRDHFNAYINMVLEAFVLRNRSKVLNDLKIDWKADASFNLAYLAGRLSDWGLKPFYVIIDEYDNFANQLIVNRQDETYLSLTGEESFLKSFFKTLKACRKFETVGRVFITGVLPITIDDLASGYNIADFLTLDPRFEALLGFTQEEVDKLLDRIYADYPLDPGSRPQVERVIKRNYNGYHFADPRGISLYNSTILMYFLEKLTGLGEIPEFLTDVNLKTDIAWVRRLTASNPEHTRELVRQLVVENRLPYNKVQLREKFDMSQFFDKAFYPASFFYLGMLTRHDEFFMSLPNLNMKTIFGEYFNEIHELDVSTRYADAMNRFCDEGDFPQLFADYWRLYVSQLPEAVFAAVNENFYRTTFYSLCTIYLSHLYVWAMETSYASGRSDLEMEGKFHTRYRGQRYMMEFKYLSNNKCNERQIQVDTFEPPAQDWAQLTAYYEERRAQNREQRIDAYLIYCFGNKGFGVFSLTDHLAHPDRKKT